MNNTFSSNPYRSPRMLGSIAIGLFAALVGCHALMFILSFVQTVFTIPVIRNDGGAMPVTFVAIGLIAILEILLRILTIIFFLVWLHRAFSNLPALRAEHLEFSPGWAVGWWFIPFANLVKPYQIMSELWNASDSDFDPDVFMSNKIGTESIIGWWWGFYIVGNIFANIAGRLVEPNSSAFWVMFYTAPLGIAAFLILKIVRKITDEQEARFQKLGYSNQFAPPPPPTFDGK